MDNSFNSPETIEIFKNSNKGLYEPISIPKLMQQVCEKFSSRNALMFRDKNCADWSRVTFKEYRDRVEHMAKVFIKLGLQPGGVVAVLANNCVEYFISELAAIHAG